MSASCNGVAEVSAKSRDAYACNPSEVCGPPKDAPTPDPNQATRRDGHAPLCSWRGAAQVRGRKPEDGPSGRPSQRHISWLEEPPRGLRRKRAPRAAAGPPTRKLNFESRCVESSPRASALGAGPTGQNGLKGPRHLGTIWGSSLIEHRKEVDRGDTCFGFRPDNNEGNPALRSRYARRRSRLVALALGHRGLGWGEMPVGTIGDDDGSMRFTFCALYLRDSVAPWMDV